MDKAIEYWFDNAVTMTGKHTALTETIRSARGVMMVSKDFNKRDVAALIALNLRDRLFEQRTAYDREAEYGRIN